MSQLPPTFRLSDPKKPSTGSTAAAGLALTLAAVGIMASAATLQVDRVARGMLADIGDALGGHADYDGLELHLTAGIAARGVRLSSDTPTRLHMEMDRIETDLGLTDLLLGARQPTEIRLVRPRIQMEADADAWLTGSHVFETARDPWAQPHSEAQSPRELSIVDGEMVLQTPLGDIGPDTLTVRHLDAQLVRSDTGWMVRGQGQIPWGEEVREVTLTALSAPEPAVHLRFNGAAGVLVPWKGRAVHMSFDAIHFEEAEGLSLEHLNIADGANRFTARRGVLRGIRDLMMPRVEDLDALLLEDASALLPSISLSVSHAILARDGDSATSITLTDPVVGWTRWGVHGQATELRATLDGSGDDLLAGDGTPELRLTAVSLDTPQVDIPLTMLDRVSQHLALPAAENGPSRTLDTHTVASIPREARRAFNGLVGLDLGWHQGTVRLTDSAGDPTLVLRDTRLRNRALATEGSRLDLSATLWRQDGERGAVEIEVELDAHGQPLRSNGRIQGSDVAHVLSRFSDYLTVAPDALLDVRYRYERDRDTVHHVEGSVEVDRFGFQAWRISHVPMTNLKGRAEFTLAVDTERQHTHLHMEKIQIADLSLEADLNLARREDRPPRVDAWIKMPNQDCGAAARAIPEAMIPRLEGLELHGEMGFTASLSADLATPEDLELAVVGDTSRCQVTSLGRHIDLDLLASGLMVHHPVEPIAGRRHDIAVGPGTSEWVPSHLIPSFVKAAARVTEDRAFSHHAGVRWDLVARALKLNLKRSRFVYGGSTITQQLVKNLYLTREKTLSRKAEELIISWALERQLSKDEILTHYLNIIEYGPNIYGLRHASRHYFAKEPRHLTPLEAAFIMGLKPYPKKGYEQWRHQRLNAWWVKRVSGVMESMRRRAHAISDADFLAAAPFQPTFRRPKQSMYTPAAGAAKAPALHQEPWYLSDAARDH